jgi:UDP-N-acetylglucosamine 3-dehydrogenase
MDKVRIGLVGCGNFGESHLQAFRAVPQAQVAAVFDTDRDRAQRIAGQFGISKICGSLQEICGLPDLAAIDVVTPEHTHLESVRTALGAGKHVFVEKPLATNLQDCSAMIEAAESAGRFLMVGQILRFETKYAMLNDEIVSGRLGKPVSMHARRNRPKSLLPLYGRTHPALENCIHDVDLMLWYTGRPVQKVRGFARHATGGKHPETFWGVMEFEGGAIGVVETIWMLPEAGIMLDDAFQFVGTEGVANLQLYTGALSILRNDGYHLPDVSYDPRVGGTARGALRDELAYFCECVQSNQAPRVITAIEAKRAVRVILALIESGESGQDVEITDWD